MNWNDYLLETFDYNHEANKKLLKKIALLADKPEAIKLFSHLANCQLKWMARILQEPGANTLSWWDPVYPFDQLEVAWTGSLKLWRDYLTKRTEDELLTEVTFTGFDNKLWAATPKDIALQLNYHSIHHRAQIQTILRQQGIEPDFLDYIGTRYRRLS